MIQDQKQLPKTDADNKAKAVRLDAVIQQISFELAKAVSKDKKKVNDLEKATGVLAQDGVYAFYVFCESKKYTVSKEKKESLWKEVIGKTIQEEFQNTTLSLPQLEIGSEINESYFKKLANNLYDMLFVKDIFDKILVYTRYHLKAMGAVEGE